MKDLELKNIIKSGDREYLISTIATKVRHTWFDADDERIVYETMVFEVIEDDVQYHAPVFNERYHTPDEAIAEHGAIIKNPEAFFIK